MNSWPQKYGLTVESTEKNSKKTPSCTDRALPLTQFVHLKVQLFKLVFQMINCAKAKYPDLPGLHVTTFLHNSKRTTYSTASVTSHQPVHDLQQCTKDGKPLIMNPLISVEMQAFNTLQCSLIGLDVSGISPWRWALGIWWSYRRTSWPTRNSMHCSRTSLSCARALGLSLTTNKCISAARNSSSSPWGSTTWAPQEVGAW